MNYVCFSPVNITNNIKRYSYIYLIKIMKDFTAKRKCRISIYCTCTTYFRSGASYYILMEVSNTTENALRLH